jgi:hypothetical protein
MPVREFKDSGGREWRAWEVTPESISPRTKEEDYLASLYYTGWIVFESKAEDDKRRLYPVPKGWLELPDPELEVLLQKAEVVPQRKLRADRAATGEAAAEAMKRASDFAERIVGAPDRAREIPREETPDVTDLGVMRSFRYPGGRIWAVCVLQNPGGGRPPVLRFSAGARIIDLEDWPKDWADLPDEKLVELLRRAAPRTTPSTLGRDGPQRRYDDPHP